MTRFTSACASGIVAVLTASLLGCGPATPSSRLGSAPTFAPKGETKCSVSSSQLEPLVVEWPSAARGELESRMRRGVVAVKFTGCELEVLPRCSAAVQYGYTGTTRKRDHVSIRDANDLYAKLPRGAVRLEGELNRSGELDVSMTVVGRFAAEKAGLGTDDLHGECAEATHVISAASVGAFDFYSVGKAEVHAGVSIGDAGVGGSSSDERHSLQLDGDENACAKAAHDDKGPPDDCSAILKIQLEPIGESKKFVPVCPEGSQWDGSACMRRQVVTAVECPSGSKWDGKTCVGLESPEGRPTPDSLHIAFKAPDGTDRWSLHDKAGALLCSLPCTHWVSPKAGYQLKKDGSSATVRLDKFEMTPGQDSDGTIHSEISGGQFVVMTIGATALTTGITLPLTLKSGGGPPPSATPFVVTAVAGGVVLVAGILWAVASPDYELATAAPGKAATAKAPAMKWHLTASGIGASF